MEKLKFPTMSIKPILGDKQAFREFAETTFKALDTNGQGFLDQKQLNIALDSIASDLGVQRPAPIEVEDVFILLDKDQDGKLSFEEFQGFLTQVLEFMAVNE